ncbi:MAG: carboxypeptidase-like regulatory domain-containing protein [Bacteroidia bacterium]|nr:carboxypeptidase-like regulatory domain-containing protein [Bacteroidia bacterium]
MFPIRAFAICLLFTVCTTLPAQNRKYQVSGLVTDSLTGKPMANVNISIVGTSGGGITNEAGQFSLQIPRIPSILYFSYVGYGIGSYQVEKSGAKNVRIALIPETQEIEEVTISAQKIAKVIRGDTLNILDYEIDGGYLILFASPLKHQSDLRIYLTTLQGEPLDFIQVKKAGKQIKYPEIPEIQTEYILRDFTGQVNYLDRVCAHEVRHAFDKLFFGYDTQYPDFIGRVFPIKCELEGKLVFQAGTPSENITWFFGRGSKEGKTIKIVRDKNPTGPYSKFVVAPLFRKEKKLYVFDFYRGHIEVFDSDLNSLRMVPIDFQFRQVTEAIFWQYQDVDSYNFTRNILYDEKAGRAYAFYRMRSNGRQSLREVNLETGKIDGMVEIPDFPNISNIRVYDNAVYFLYDTKVYPYYRLLYRMAI